MFIKAQQQEGNKMKLKLPVNLRRMAMKMPKKTRKIKSCENAVDLEITEL